ncbi:MAG: Rab family GTPase [Candidatus Thorarchaeota archaeon]
MSPQYLFKIVTVGAPAVGKTSLILRYTTGRFREYYAPTLGADFAVKALKVDDDTVRLQIWDLGSQDFLGRVRAQYYLGSRAAIFVYDMTRRETLEQLRLWKQEVERHAGRVHSVVIGNKSDLASQREVSREVGEELAHEFEADYLEVSVKLNENVDEVFKRVSEQLLENMV